MLVIVSSMLIRLIQEFLGACGVRKILCMPYALHAGLLKIGELDYDFLLLCTSNVFSPSKNNFLKVSTFWRISKPFLLSVYWWQNWHSVHATAMDCGIKLLMLRSPVALEEALNDSSLGHNGQNSCKTMKMLSFSAATKRKPRASIALRSSTDSTLADSDPSYLMYRPFSRRSFL